VRDSREHIHDGKHTTLKYATNAVKYST
jgi:hypothetical protein